MNGQIAAFIHSDPVRRLCDYGKIGTDFRFRHGICGKDEFDLFSGMESAGSVCFPSVQQDLTGADTLLPRGAAAVGEACGKIQIQPYAFRLIGDGTANDPVLRIRFIFC